MKLWQPITREEFGPGMANLAGCADCDTTWLLDENGCFSVDQVVMWCPICDSTNCGPVYAVPDDASGGES